MEEYIKQPMCGFDTIVTNIYGRKKHLSRAKIFLIFLMLTIISLTAAHIVLKIRFRNRTLLPVEKTAAVSDTAVGDEGSETDSLIKKFEKTVYVDGKEAKLTVETDRSNLCMLWIDLEFTDEINIGDTGYILSFSYTSSELPWDHHWYFSARSIVSANYELDDDGKINSRHENLMAYERSLIPYLRPYCDEMYSFIINEYGSCL